MLVGMSTPLPQRAELVRQADAVATVIAVASGSYGVLLSVLYEPFGSADLFTFEAARWSAWLNIAAAVDGIAFMFGHRLASRAALRRGGDPQRAFERVGFAALVAAMLISVGHCYIGGSQSTILPVTGVLLAALATWFLPWRAVVALAAVWVAGYATVVGLEAGGALPYAPIFRQGEVMAPLFLDWRSLLGMSVLTLMLFGSMMGLLYRFHGPLHASRTAVEQAVEARTEALRAAHDSLDRHLDHLRTRPAEQRVRAAEDDARRADIEHRLRRRAASVRTAEAAARLDRHLADAHARARRLAEVLESGAEGPRLARRPLVDLRAALDGISGALVDVRTAPGRVTAPPTGASPTSLDEMARAVAALLRRQAADDGVRVQLELGRTPPLDVDRAALEQALFAVMHNALRAVAGQRSRRVIVRTRVEARAVLLEVHDTGPGLPAEDVFEAGVGRWRGQGMGLTLARETVEGHGGSLTGGPSPHGGALVRLSLARPAVGLDEAGRLSDAGGPARG